MQSSRLLIVPALAVCLSGGLTSCVVGTVAHVATAPVRVAGKAVDWSTTSRSEADRNRGRALRRCEKRMRQAHRDTAACLSDRHVR